MEVQIVYFFEMDHASYFTCYSMGQDSRLLVTISFEYCLKLYEHQHDNCYDQNLETMVNGQAQ